MKNLNLNEVINRGETELKKTEGKKRKSPCTPYREKGKGKETKPGFMNESISPRACARSEAGKKELGVGVRGLGCGQRKNFFKKISPNVFGPTNAIFGKTDFTLFHEITTRYMGDV